MAADASATAALDRSAFPVPSYLPAPVRRVVPWARRHVARVASRYQVAIEDLWDEAITALVRASVYHDAPEQIAGTKDRYCQTAVHRACWHYVVRGHTRRQARGWREPISVDELELASASAEEEVMAREAAYLRAQDCRDQDSTALRARKTARSAG